MAMLVPKGIDDVDPNRSFFIMVDDMHTLSLSVLKQTMSAELIKCPPPVVTVMDYYVEQDEPSQSFSFISRRLIMRP